ncbi:mitochondrial carrier [Aspergillus eucalypticola CBS 122712]|uniref:Mitochondrial carrier n=1 Tax=Aspergillus eucalypticola (strain CBS 122712 / IBT 29274) TaxID=1448314 RepID=A0A317UV61_ASPEC|nr:mitochondrial carrier [Aspergillus eucalypticola CBS 122712]PWY65933.1 mitochondrial carrier [Aspergillus eucalypticola CBS 122712]
MTTKNQLSPWETVASGTTASILANVIVYPLDNIKTKLQVHVQRRQRTTQSEEKGELGSPPPSPPSYDSLISVVTHIIQEEGLPGLYRGLGSSILNTASMNFAYFYWSSHARTAYQKFFRGSHNPVETNIVTELLLGAVGGAMAQLCTNPIAVIVTRQQTCRASDDAKSMIAVLREIVNLILVVNPMITYGLYQWLRGELLRVRAPLSSMDAFLLGALSKVAATVVTHPLIVAKTMLQSKTRECHGERPFQGFTEVLRFIVRHEGMRRLYKGLGPQIVKGFLVQGLMMMLKERAELLFRLVMLSCRKRFLRASF